MPDVRGGIGADAEWSRHCGVSTSDRTFGSTSIDVSDTGIGVGRSNSGEGLGTNGRAVAGVDPVADPKGPGGAKGKPAGSVQAGTPLGSMGPEGVLEGAGDPNILCRAA